MLSGKTRQSSAHALQSRQWHHVRGGSLDHVAQLASLKNSEAMGLDEGKLPSTPSGAAGGAAMDFSAEEDPFQEGVAHHAEHGFLRWLISPALWRTLSGKELAFYLFMTAMTALAISLMAAYSARASIDVAFDALLTATITRVSTESSNFLRVPLVLNDQLNSRLSLLTDEYALSPYAADDVYFTTQLAVYPSITASYVAWQSGAYDGYLVGAGHYDGDVDSVMVLSDETGGCLAEFALAAGGAQRNESAPAADPDCGFVIAERSWFTAAVGAETPGADVFSDVYADALSGEQMVTAARAVYAADGSGTLLAVVAVDLTLDSLSDVLATAETEESGRAYLADSDGLLLASSDFNVVDDDSQERLSASSADVVGVVRDSAYTIVKYYGSWADVPLEEGYMHFFKGDLDDLDMDVVILSKLEHELHDAGVDWTLVVAVPKEDYFPFVQAVTGQTVLISLAAALAYAWLFYHNRHRHRWHEETSAEAERRKQQEHMRRKSSVSASSVRLDRLEVMTDDVDYWVVALMLIVVIQSLVTYMVWRDEAEATVDFLASKLTDEVAELSLGTVTGTIASPVVVGQVLTAEWARRGYLAKFDEPVDSTCAAALSASVPTVQVEDSLLQYLATMLDSYSDFEFPVEYVGGACDNKVAFWAWRENATQSYFFVSDNTTVTDGVSALAMFDIDPDTRLPLRDTGLLVSSPYVPTTRPFFTDGETGEYEVPQWTDVYTYVTGDELGIDATVLLNGTSAAFSPALEYDWSGRYQRCVLDLALSLRTISEHMTEGSENLSNVDAVGMLTEFDADTGLVFDYLVAASEGDVTTLAGAQSLANESTSETVAEVTQEVNERVLDLDRDLGADGFYWEGEARYGSSKCWVVADKVVDAYGVDWMFGMAIPQAAFYEDIDDWNAVSMLVAAGLVVATIYVIVGMHILRNTSVSARTLDDELENIESPEHWREVAAELLEDVNMANHNVKVGEESYARARRYIHDSYHIEDRHILDTLCIEARSYPGSALPGFMSRFLRSRGTPFWDNCVEFFSLFTLYQVYTSKSYRGFVQFIILCHCSISFWEAPAYDDGDEEYYSEYGPNMLLLNFFCVAVHMTDLAIHLALFGPWQRGRRTSSQLRFSKMTLFRIGLVVAMLVDNIMIAATDYVTDFSLYSYEEFGTLLPYTAALRPLLLVARNKEVEIAVSNFVITLLLAKNVVIVGFSFLFVATAMAITLLSGICYDEDAIGRNVGDYRSALIMMFIFVFTGENYPSVVHPASDKTCPGESRWFRLYFVFFSFLGMFLLVSLIIAHFQDAYSERLKQLKAQQTKEHRLSMLAAFLVLDFEDNSAGDRQFTLDADEHANFFKYCGVGSTVKAVYPALDENERPIMGPKLMEGHEPEPLSAFDCSLEILDFVSLIENLIYEGHMDYRTKSLDNVRMRKSDFYEDTSSNRLFDAGRRVRDSVQSISDLGTSHMSTKCPTLYFAYKWVQFNLKKFYAFKHYNHIVLFGVLLNLWVMCLVGTTVGASLVEELAIVFVFINVGETSFRLLAEGPMNFLLKHSKEDPYRRIANQFDFLVSLVTLVAFVYTRAHSGFDDGLEDSIDTNDEGTPRNVVLALPTLRIFSIVDTNKQLVFGLLTILRGFYALMILLCIAVYVFAVWGTLLFAGLFTYMPESVYELPESNFNSLTESGQTLWQLMLGESWDDVMSAGIDTHWGYAAALYFMFYVVTMGTLFSNLFIGIVCSAFSRLSDYERDRAKNPDMKFKSHIAQVSHIMGSGVSSSITGRSVGMVSAANVKAAANLFKAAGMKRRNSQRTAAPMAVSEGADTITLQPAPQSHPQEVEMTPLSSASAPEPKEAWAAPAVAVESAAEERAPSPVAVESAAEERAPSPVAVAVEPAVEEPVAEAAVEPAPSPVAAEAEVEATETKEVEVEVDPAPEAEVEATETKEDEAEATEAQAQAQEVEAEETEAKQDEPEDDEAEDDEPEDNDEEKEGDGSSEGQSGSKKKKKNKKKKGRR